MKCLLSILSIGLLCGLSKEQCDNTLPDGTMCGQDDYVQVPDPDSCFKYYQCEKGCVTHETCPGDQQFDPAQAWCTYPQDVDCGDRPCPPGNVHCPPPRTTTTKEPDCTPEDQWIDCKEMGPGYYPDEYNCRKFWHCIKGSDTPDHITCPHGHDDPKATMYDLAYNGCNFPEYTQCGGRPVCDDCNMNCEATPTTPEDCVPDNEHINCKELGAGWYTDEFNCRAFWHCLNEDSEAEHLFCPYGNIDPKATKYNPVYHGCDFPENVACGDRPICDECNANCEHEEDPVNCGHDLDCSTKPNGWYADPYSCQKYWNCQNGVGHHLMCADGLMYEPTRVQCDYPDRVECGNRPPCNECDEGCP